MCYHPITILNPTKYVSLSYRDRFLLRVPCGKCAQCQEQKSQEYYFRAFYHAREALKNGFVLFDTLTYSDASLPRLRDFFPFNIPNYPCFSSRHIRLFVSALRQRLKRNYNSNFDFMLSSEYGTSPYHTHRPHYHVLFFVSGSITPQEMSQEISDCWSYGRTDGMPYKSEAYVLNNTLEPCNLAQNIRILKYVTKYISKSCLFTLEIEKRANSCVLAMRDIYEAEIDTETADDWYNGLQSKKFKESIMRHIGQFHRQSTGFGASFLRDCDINQLFKDCSISVRDNEKVILQIPLPQYYKRKLFYEQVEVDGCRCWQPTILGKEYLRHQQLHLVGKLKERYTAAKFQCKLDFNVDEMVDYIVYRRGRIIADLDESTIEERLSRLDLYKYCTRYDKQHFKQTGLVTKWCGNSTCGYTTEKLPKPINLYSFSSRFSYLDEEKEKLLSIIDDIYIKLDKSKQIAYEIKERVRNALKMLYG